MIFETNKDKGRVGMALGIAYFGANGYTVNIPLNDTQWYDFVVEKDGKFYTVQCKATGSKDNIIKFTSSGGTKGKLYDSILNHSLDFLFCVDKDCNMFLFPIEDIKKAGNTQTITLRIESPNKSATGIKIDSSKYLVKIN